METNNLKDLLIFEERIKQNLHVFNKSERRYKIAFLLFIIFISSQFPNPLSASYSATDYPYGYTTFLLLIILLAFVLFRICTRDVRNYQVRLQKTLKTFNLQLDEKQEISFTSKTVQSLKDALYYYREEFHIRKYLNAIRKRK